MKKLMIALALIAGLAVAQDAAAYGRKGGCNSCHERKCHEPKPCVAKPICKKVVCGEKCVAPIRHESYSCPADSKQVGSHKSHRKSRRYNNEV